MSIVQKIQGLCINKDLTLVGLEREIGLGRGTIRNWDKNSPSSDKLLKVANYFHVSMDYLLERTLTPADTHLNQYVALNQKLPNVMQVLFRDGGKMTPEREKLIARLIETAIEDK